MLSERVSKLANDHDRGVRVSAHQSEYDQGDNACCNCFAHGRKDSPNV